MHIPPISHRQWGVSQQGAEEHHPSEEQDKQRFASLLGLSPKKRDSSSTIAGNRGSDTRNKTFHWEGANGLPMTVDLKLKNALTSSWLRWRLTNGPLAGLEIEACRQSDEMAIRLRAEDLAQLLKRLGSASQLEQQLSRQFNCHVKVEMSHAHSGAE
ncbi:hypothetical protein [Winslowiella iniecta]|uniref:Uncharacterized protein n=1 Tax=Winslowiella iniecta TaxID=1560201 RepID=A0A0L7SXC9_9GAMM|nr:hypothetical protein [Winslowiella iniecta]KOC87782.1 hypothetical protein NG42_18960 [Winslowiella iniecta]KOC90044.1 hypothetical protein NG43_17795 [Winslowiella iniecta]